MSATGTHSFIQTSSDCQQQNVSFFGSVLSQSSRDVYIFLAVSLLDQEVFWIRKPQTPNSSAIRSHRKDAGTMTSHLTYTTTI
jgi:hypothetical protein